MVELEEQHPKLSYSDYIRLTGITALVSLKHFYKNRHGLFTSSGDFIVTFDNEYIKMVVNIDVNEKIINVIEFKSKGKLDHVFLRILYSMQYFGTLYGYKSINIIARGSRNHPKKLIGYIIAGKYGFLMGGSDESYFKKIAITKGKPSYSHIYAMLLDGVGLEIWSRQGKEWLGTFYLEVGSFSKFLIEDFLKRKNVKGKNGIITGL